MTNVVVRTIESADLRCTIRPQRGAKVAVLRQFSQCNIAQKRSDVVYNGLSGRVSSVKVVDSVETDPIMYRGSNRKSIVASSFLQFRPYFYFWFGRMALGDRLSV